MKMFNFLLASTLGGSLVGCFPIQMDATLTWGGNQTVKKTLDVNQVQTDAQVAAGSEFMGDVVSGVVAVAPLLLREVPQPTPTPKYEIIGPLPLATLPPAAVMPPPVERPRPPVRHRKAKVARRAEVPKVDCTRCCPMPSPTPVEDFK